MRALESTGVLIASLLVVDSLHFVFARALLPYLPPETSVLFVMGTAAAQWVVIQFGRRRFSLVPLRSHLWFFLAIGLLVAASSNLNYAAVASVDPGTAALLGKTSVLFGLGFGLLWLRERLTRLESLGAVVAILGAFGLTYQPGDYLRLGAVMVLVSTFLYELHAALVKRHGGSIDFGDFFLFRLLSTTGFLLLFAAGRGGLIWPGARAWLILLLAGTLDVVVSRSLYYLALRRLRISVLGIVLTLSPVITILWSLALFGTVPASKDLVGGAAVLSGILIVVAGRSKNVEGLT